MDAQGCRKAIIECFERIEKLGGNLAKDFAPLKAQAQMEQSPRKLFLMLQTLREVMAKDTPDADTSFEMFTPDGSVVKVASLDEGLKVASRMRKKGG